MAVDVKDREAAPAHQQVLKWHVVWDQTLLVSASSVVTLWRLGRPPNNPEPAQRSNQSQSPAGAVKAVERRHLVPDKTNPRTTSSDTTRYPCVSRMKAHPWL